MDRSSISPAKLFLLQSMQSTAAGEIVDDNSARIYVDNLFRHHIAITETAPEFRALLINGSSQSKEAVGLQTTALTPSALLGSAAKAVINAARTGFELVDDNTFTARINACCACPERRDMPESILYSLFRGVNEQNYICGLCGCSIRQKARLKSEKCPGIDPNRLDCSRWDAGIK